MKSKTKKVALYYGLWVLLCVVLAAIGYGDHKAGHIYLIFTGLPFSLFSLGIIPNGSTLATLVAGAIGWLQWCLIVEISLRVIERSKSKNVKT